jgi:hypothetical protein
MTNAMIEEVKQTGMSMKQKGRKVKTIPAHTRKKSNQFI